MSLVKLVISQELMDKLAEILFSSLSLSFFLPFSVSHSQKVASKTRTRTQIHSLLLYCIFMST